MRQILILVIGVLLTYSPMTSAQELHNHDPNLVGTWFSESHDGSLAELEMHAGGKFVFDFRSGNSLERTYMCGTWDRQNELIELDIQAHKNRLSNGSIEQATGEQRGNFEVVRATHNSLVLRIERRVVSFYRTG